MNWMRAVWLLAVLLLTPLSEARSQSRSETLLVVVELRPQQHGHPRRRREPARLSASLESLRPAADLRREDAARRHADLRLLGARSPSWPRAGRWRRTACRSPSSCGKNARFHDGTPVTAKDVKWSFDRAVTVGGFPTFQMKAGSLEKPEQFAVVDDHTFRVNVPAQGQADHAGPRGAGAGRSSTPSWPRSTRPQQDPWALDWLKNNVAGGGAYKVESWKPGQEIVFVRYDDWKMRPAAQAADA